MIKNAIFDVVQLTGTEMGSMPELASPCGLSGTTWVDAKSKTFPSIVHEIPPTT
jgi:hypothetical protein